MNITVQVDEVSLNTIVGEIVGWDAEDGEPVTQGERTVAHLVAEMIVDRLAQSKSWPGLHEQMTEIRAEAIREAVRPQVEAAIAKPVRKTNTWGEPAGPETTLRELITEEARKWLAEPADRYDRGKGTLLSRTVAAEVKKALSQEIADAVKQARELVAGQIGEQVAAAVAEGMRRR